MTAPEHAPSVEGAAPTTIEPPQVQEQRSTAGQMTFADAAVTYAVEVGWPVFPASATKRPVIATGRDHAEGASRDEATIRRWFERDYRGCAIAMPTGAASGVVVIDADAKHDGERVLVELEARYGALDRRIVARTQSGGIHVYFRHPGGRVKTCVGGDSSPWPEHGVDVRGDGGIVLLPPSLGYAWERLADELPELPAGWVEALRTAPRRVLEPVEIGEVTYSPPAELGACLDVLRTLRDRYRRGERDGDEGRADLLARVLDGRALAEVGGRDSAVTRAAYIIGRALPEIGPDAALAIADASIRTMPATSDGEDAEHWIAKFAASYERGAEATLEDRERERERLRRFALSARRLP